MRFNKQMFQQVAFGQVRLYPRTVTQKTMPKEIGIEVWHNPPEPSMGHVELGLLFLQLAQVVSYSFNNLLYKEWVTDDDKDCSIIPIKLKRYKKKL